MFLRHVLGHVLGFLLILAASVLPGVGQTRPNSRATYSIAGSVSDDTGQHRMENIRVDLKQVTGVPVNTTFTRGNGEFEFTGLPNGEYVIDVAVKDYEPVQLRVTISGLGRREMNIFLTRPATVVNSNSGASISAHELSVPSKAHEEYVKGLNLMYGKSDYRGAIVQFQRAIKDFRSFYEAYAQEGNAYLRLGEMASAEEAMRKSVDLSSGQYSNALFMLAAFLTEAKRYSEAVTFARQGIAVDDSSWQGPFELARALLGLQQMEEAEKSAIQARNMKPDNPPVYLLLANILIQRRDYPALLKDLDAYLKLVPSGPEADQARKTRDDLQAFMQKADNQIRASAQEKVHPETQNSTRANAPPPAPENEPPPPPGPDSSGLPPLAPPVSNNQ